MIEFIDQLLDSNSIILILPATYAICFLIIAAIRRKIRETKLRKTAIKLDMKFSAVINEQVTSSHKIPDLAQVYRVKLRNLFVGKTHGFSLAIYDQTNTRRKKPSIKRTFARVDLRQFQLPHFKLTSNSILDKLIHQWVKSVVHFEEDKVFSKAYKLKVDQSLRAFTQKDFETLIENRDAKDKYQEVLRTHDGNEDDVRNLFQEEFRALCLKHDMWHIRSENGYLYFNWSNKRLAPRQYPKFIEDVNEIVHHLKDAYLVK